MKSHETKILKTQEKIYNAVIALAQTKNIQQIKVSELCRASGINRSTFYLHFEDIPNLIEQMKDYAGKTIFEEIKTKRRRTTLVVDNFEETILIGYQDFLHELRQAKKFSPLVTTLLGENGDPRFYNQLRQKLRNLFAYFFEDYLPEIQAKFKDVPPDYLDIFLYDTTVDVVMHWIEKGMKESPEDLFNILRHARFATPFAVIDGVDK